MAYQSFGPIRSATVAPIALGAPNVLTVAPVDASKLPHGFPAAADERMAWTGVQLQDHASYTYHLTKHDVAELEAALTYFKTLGLDGDLVNRDNFGLPELGPKLSQLSEEIHFGKGFCVVRGLNPSAYSVEDVTLLWLGVQVYIADCRGRQDHKGNMLVHIVADNSNEIKLDHHRHSNSAITFHNEESGDVIGWLTRNTAAAGGSCIIASVYTVYNVMAAHRPDMIRTLAKADWPFAFPQFQCRPVIFSEDSRIMMNFGRTPLIGSASHPRPRTLPQINERQREALDAIEAIAKATQLEIETRPGDMHFINNHTVLHSRQGFVDGAASGEKRHLIRMRLRSSQLGWAIPDTLQGEWRNAFHHDTEKTWHLEPMPGEVIPLRKYPN